jgi:hypothetical protein
VKARWTYSAPSSVGSQNLPPKCLFKEGNPSRPQDTRLRGGALLLCLLHQHIHTIKAIIGGEGKILAASRIIGGQRIITLIINRYISINITIPSLMHLDLVLIPSTIGLPLDTIFTLAIHPYEYDDVVYCLHV